MLADRYSVNYNRKYFDIIFAVCYGGRGRALALQTGARVFAPQYGGRLPSLIYSQLLESIYMS